MTEAQKLRQSALAKIAEARAIAARFEGGTVPRSAVKQIADLTKQATELKDQAHEAYMNEPRGSVTAFDAPTVRGIDGRTNKIEDNMIEEKMWAPEGASFKDVSGGGLNFPEAFDTDIATDPRQSRFLQGMLSKRRVEGGTAFAFMRLSLRDNQAAFVARLEAKPVSLYETARIEDKIDEVARPGGNS